MAVIDAVMPIDPGASTRERILVATLKVISEDGVDRLTHRRVAETAGVSLGSTTRYSSDRMDLVRQACAYYVDWAVGQSQEFASVGQPADAAALAAMAAEFLQPNEVLAAEFELLVLAHRDAELSRMITAGVDAIDIPTRDYLAGLGVADPGAGARLIRAIVRGSAIEYLSETRITDELETRLRLVIEAMPKKESP